TGESYALADTTFRFAASTYKLPLNMYYYEQELAGAMSGDDLIADYTLAKCHYLTMVWSDNDSAIAMLRELGKFRTYRELMLTYGKLEESEIEPIYYADNYCCTKYMLNVLRYLYERQDTFAELIGYMKQAQQSEYFCAGVDEYEIAHKYGFLEGAYNDVGIIYTPTPYLLAVYTQDVPNADALLGDINRLFCDYTIAAR
ncbi:MAG: serine hydrolase, partial [Syntrophomonadaceae bacterium]|nr:serine hydrolase [Syntrophomonadaceae bacterium]